MSDERHPVEELAGLAAGLGAALDRRRRSGHRHLPLLGSAALTLPAKPDVDTAAKPDVDTAAKPDVDTAAHPDIDTAEPPTLAAAPRAGSDPAPDGGRPAATAPTAPAAARATAPSTPGSPPMGGETASRGPHNAFRPNPGEATTPRGETGGALAGSPAPARSEAASPPAGTTADPSPVDAETKHAPLAKGLAPGAAQLFLEKLEQVGAAARGARDLGELQAAVAACRACRLCEGRTQTVFADGSASARVMFIGEGPGAEEDRTGVPFVGAAGQLLTGIIEKGMRLERAKDVYIANVVKCRPPSNRDPNPHEKAICSSWLERQIELVDPELIIPLGGHATGHVLGAGTAIGRVRGRVHEHGGRRFVPTYHPAWVLHQPEEAQPAAKAKIWADIQVAMRELGLPR